MSVLSILADPRFPGRYRGNLKGGGGLPFILAIVLKLHEIEKKNGPRGHASLASALHPPLICLALKIFFTKPSHNEFSPNLVEIKSRTSSEALPIKSQN